MDLWICKNGKTHFARRIFVGVAADLVVGTIRVRLLKDVKN
jgi:hypothetical protein